MPEAPQDIRRLVYPPKVWIFVKNIHEEIIDLTEYCVGGEVKRLLNQASSAEIRLRNPEKIFTASPGKYAAFHPMDPIVIFMERFPGLHVQVFTGYLDSTPYLQLFPGIVTLKATCTLKKLMFTYFQMAQQYTLEFFKHFGWNLTANGVIGPNQGGLVESALEMNETKKWEKELKEKKSNGQPKLTQEEFQKKKTAQLEAAKAIELNTQLAGGEGTKKISPKAIPFSEEAGAKASNDGSFSKIVWALLYYIADWRDNNIYVEAMPASVPKLISALWANFENAGHKAAKEDLEAFWTALIGPASQGSGGMGSIHELGEPKGEKNVVPIMAAIAEENNVPPAFVINTSLNECSFNPNKWEEGAELSIGWFQWNFGSVKDQAKGNSTPYSFASSSSYTLKQAKDIGVATAVFCQAAKVKRPKTPPESEWEEWAKEVQGSEGYPKFAETLPEVKRWISQYAKPETQSKGGTSAGNKNLVKGELGEEPEEQQRGSTDKSGKPTKKETHAEALEDAAEKIAAKHYPYVWDGGHTKAGEPSMGNGEDEGAPLGPGYDCSGAVTAVLSLAGYKVSPMGSTEYMTWGEAGPDPKGRITIYANSDHVFMKVGKGEKYFAASTAGHPDNAENNKGARLLTAPDGEISLFTQRHPPGLEKEASVELTGASQETTAGAGSESANISGTATAASFLSNIQFPSVEEREAAYVLGGQSSLMNSMPVMNMVQQVCEASLRSFQSLPNGDFYAFYPDYFGEFGHREVYWEIKNIEILSGEIELNDQTLVTHAFAIGNTTWPADVPLINEVNAGVMTIFEAFTPGILFKKNKSEITGREPGSKNAQSEKEEAIAFLQRYGARPLKYEAPTVYSSLFETLLSYQQFLLAWARQFKTTFLFCFMPELFPGGKVGFPEHGIKMYVESVTHTWDLEDGFRTNAELLAPSIYKTPWNAEAVAQLPENMVAALIEPLKGQVSKEPTKQKAIPPRVKIDQGGKAHAA